MKAWIKIRTGQTEAASSIVDKEMAPKNLKVEALVDGRWEVI